MKRNRDVDIASAVVSEQLNRLLERERKDFTPPPMSDLEQLYPFLDKDQASKIVSHISSMSEVVLHMIVMMKISVTARLN